MNRIHCQAHSCTDKRRTEKFGYFIRWNSTTPVHVLFGLSQMKTYGNLYTKNICTTIQPPSRKIINIGVTSRLRAIWQRTKIELNNRTVCNKSCIKCNEKLTKLFIMFTYEWFVYFLFSIQPNRASGVFPVPYCYSTYWKYPLNPLKRFHFFNKKPNALESN